MERQQDYVLRSVEERGVRLIRLWFTDVLGQLKSFAISPAELENALEEGMTFDGSSIDGFSRVQESDVLAMPDPNTFELLPWADPRRRPRPGCSATSATSTARRSRAIPARCCAATSTGPASGASRSTSPPRWSSSTSPTATRDGRPEPLDAGRYFDLTTADVASDLRKRTIQTLEAMGIPVEYSFHEDAPSQHEIDLRYTDALTMADNVMTFRLVVREIGRSSEGLYATFMPKPLDGRAGLGHAHPHVACSRATRTPSTTPGDPYGLSKVGQGLHRRPAAPRPRDHRRHQPAR